MASRVVTVTVNDLQKEFEKVKEGLKDVDENIKKLTGRDPAEFRSPGNRRVVLKRDFGKNTSDGPGPAKRRSFGSVLSRPVGSGERRLTSDKLDSEGEEEEDKEKPSIQSSVVAQPSPSRLKQDAIINTDARTKSRNQRMFGMLLGTLQRFKKESTDQSEKEKRRAEIVKKLEVAEEKEKEEVATQKKDLFNERRAKQAKLKRLEQQMELVELQKDWEEHDIKLCSFIKTKAKPAIFYIPAKHTPKTTRLLEASTRTLKENIEKRKAALEEEMETEIDDQEQTNGEGRQTEMIEGGGEPQERMQTEELNNELEHDRTEHEQWVEKGEVNLDVDVEDGEVRERKRKDSDRERKRKSQSIDQD